ncbi:type I-E CRISPR-associated protein Cas7/Cse4/CasC [Corynebacterium camporealensis]
MSLFVDVHALQTVPPSLINRDEDGAPKTAIFGGTPRQRVSSQAWKRAIRKYIEENLDAQAVGRRSRRLPGVIAQQVEELAPEFGRDKAIAGVRELFKAAKIKLVDPKSGKDEEPLPGEEGLEEYPQTGYLLFLSPQQIERAAKEIVDRDASKFVKKEAEEILDTKHSVDIAMFGRMLADAPSYNVDASVQVAHALSVHGTEPEFDYFTAVDDVVEDAEEAGAGMIGTVAMMSSTLYRYATVNVSGLAENLGDAASAKESIGYFVKAFIESMPTGKVNTFANNTLPELVLVTVRDDRAISLVNAFEEPAVETEDATRRQVAAERIAAEEKQIRESYGFVPKAAFVMTLGGLDEYFDESINKVILNELIDGVKNALEEA